jgi:hypothetical protein
MKSIEGLVIIILFGLVILCGCCVGSYFCYLENKHTQEWAKGVRARKRGDVIIA